MRSGSLNIFLTVALVVWALVISGASQQNTQEIVSATMSAPVHAAAPGQTISISIRLDLAEDAHANSNFPEDPNLIPTVFVPTAANGIKWGESKYPAPTSIVVTYSPKPLSVFENGATITTPLTLAADLSLSEITVSGYVRVQVCDRFQCYPPKRIPVSLRIQIGSGLGSGKSAVPGAVKEPIAPASTQTSTKPIDFDFVDFSGKSRKLSEFRGKFVLLDFWATWCRPCLADIPKLKKLYDKHRAGGFEIIGMDSETIGDEAEAPDLEFAKESDQRARQIVATRGVTWPQATWDTAVPVAIKIFSVKVLPTKILLDKEGKIIATIGEKDDLEGIVEKLLAVTN